MTNSTAAKLRLLAIFGVLFIAGATFGVILTAILARRAIIQRPVMHATYNNETGMTISGVCPPHMTPQANKTFPTTLDQALNATCVWVVSSPQSVTLLHWTPETKTKPTLYGKLLQP